MYMSHVTRLVITSPVSSSTSSSSHLSSHYRHVCQCQLPRMPGGSQGSLMSVSSRDVTSTFLYQANHWSQTNINLVKPFAKRQQHKQFCTSKTLFENVFSFTQFYTMFDQYYLNSFLIVYTHLFSVQCVHKNGRCVNECNFYEPGGVVSLPTCHIMSTWKIKIPSKRSEQNTSVVLKLHRSYPWNSKQTIIFMMTKGSKDRMSQLGIKN